MSVSFWQAQVGLPGLDQTSTQRDTIDTDFCIVGAGIIGAGLAHWAKKRGRSGIVLEARAAAMGASGRNAGFVLSGIAASYAAAVRAYGREGARELWALSIENRNTMLALAERFKVPTERCGSLLLAESEEEKEELAASAELLAEDGFAGTYTPHDPLERGFVAALERPGDGVTQPAALCRAILHESGFRLLGGSPVHGFEEAGEAVLVHSERATVRARQLILATNAYSASLHPYFEGKVRPMRGQILITEPGPMGFHTAGYSHYGFWYFRQVPEPGKAGMGRWLIGGGRHLHFESENDNSSEAISPAVQRDLEAWSQLHFPEFAALPVAHRWAGTMGFTRDGLPLVGRLPGHERVAFCVGFNGHGMGLGIMVAQRALALLDEGRSPGLFDAARLEEGKDGAVSGGG